MTNKEKRTEGLEMTVKLRKMSGLEKDEMNNNGPYVCSQYFKLIGPKGTVCDRLDTFMGKKSKAWGCMSIQLQCSGILLLFYFFLLF